MVQPSGYLRVRDPELFDLLMTAQGLSQRELARRAGCHRRTISYLLSRDRRASQDLAGRISECLKSRVTVLFTPGGDPDGDLGGGLEGEVEVDTDAAPDNRSDRDRSATAWASSNGTHGRITEAA